MPLAQRPQRSDAGEARTRGLSASCQALYHWATALPFTSSRPLGLLSSTLPLSHCAPLYLIAASRSPVKHSTTEPLRSPLPHRGLSVSCQALYHWATALPFTSSRPLGLLSSTLPLSHCAPLYLIETPFNTFASRAADFMNGVQMFQTQLMIYILLDKLLVILKKIVSPVKLHVHVLLFRFKP